MDITARIEAVDETHSKLVGASEVSMSGKAAAFGSRLAGAVADQVIGQFAANFTREVATQATATTTIAEPAPAPPGGGAEAAPAAASGATPAPAPPPSAPLNAFALAWGVLKAWLRSLFGARRA
jgi:hypothetical protein